MKLTIQRAGQVAPSEYPFPTDWTYREKHVVKHVTGLREGEIFEAMQAGDADVSLAFAIVALCRTGEIDAKNLKQAEMLMDELEQVELDLEEDEAVPPAVEEPPATDAPERVAVDEPPTSSDGSSSSTTLEESGAPNLRSVSA